MILFKVGDSVPFSLEVSFVADLALPLFFWSRNETGHRGAQECYRVEGYQFETRLLEGILEVSLRSLPVDSKRRTDLSLSFQAIRQRDLDSLARETSEDLCRVPIASFLDW